VLQAHGDSPDLGETVPFTPVAIEAPALARPRLEVALDWVQRWRLPVTLVLGTLIATAAFFAYESQSGPGADPGAPAGGTAPGGADGDSAMVGAVDGMVDEPGAEGQREEPTRDPASGVAPPTTAGDRGQDELALLREAARPEASERGAAGSTSLAAADDAVEAGGGRTTVAGAETTGTTAPSTTRPEVTTGSSAAEPTTTADTRPIRIGDRVSYERADGRGVAGVAVALLSDSDRDGVGESTRSTVSTGGDGAYGFSVEPGCYVVGFTVPDGHRVLSGQASRALCLDPGQENARIDLVLSPPHVRAPPGCEVQIGRGRSAGVEVHDSTRDWAPSYVFYDRSGNRILSTSSLGPPDDHDRGSSDIEWTSRRYGYEESEVHSVAAEDDDGFVSERVTCRRRRV
jgi:hypothetical protein